MSRLTPGSALASLRSPVEDGVLSTFARTLRPLFELPEVTRLMPRVPDHLTGINLGTSAALNAVLAAVKPASAMSDIFAQLNLANGGLSANYASQLSQMLSQRDALAGVVASSAASDVIARSGLGVHSAFVAAQAAQIVNAQDSIARLIVTTRMSASKDSLRDTLS